MKHCYLAAFSILFAGGLTANAQTGNVLTAENLSLERKQSIENIEALVNEDLRSLNLADQFLDPDDPDASFSFEIILNSNPDVASLSISESQLEIDFQNPGQTTAILQATANDKMLSDTFVIGVRPLIEGYAILSDLEESVMDENSYWNGADESGGMTSGKAYFKNDYNPDWFSWSGWAVSNTSDNISPGFMNQYSAFSTVRLDSSSGKNYAVAYPYPVSEITMSDSVNRKVKGFFITNSTYAALAMKNGDAYSKKFGGADGTEPDWFKLAITGYTYEGDSVGTVYFKLADYTFDDHDKDYIVETWQWIDLSAFEEVFKLTFSLSSTDNGDWGMNTPGFFCLDNLYIGSVTDRPEKTKQFKLSIYPNPSKGQFFIDSENKIMVDIAVYTLEGKEIYSAKDVSSGRMIDLSGHQKGMYILKISGMESSQSKMILIQ